MPADKSFGPPRAAGTFGSTAPTAARGCSGFELGRNRVAVPERLQQDRQLTVERLAGLADSFDLAEPFGRIRDAIEEARQAVAMTIHWHAPPPPKAIRIELRIEAPSVLTGGQGDQETSQSRPAAGSACSWDACRLVFAASLPCPLSLCLRSAWFRFPLSRRR